MTSGAPACLCERGLEEVDGRCFPITPCGPVRPADDGGCSGEPRWDCSRKTVSSAADPAEPNDCPPQARALEIDGSAIGAFGEADDLDWYFIAGAANVVVKLSATGSQMSVASYDADGFPVNAHLDLDEPFSVGARGLFLVVRAVDQGPYRLTLERLGEDDRTNEVFDALDAAPDSTVRGTLDFPRDVDVVALRLAPASSADVQLLPGARLDVLDTNGRLLISTESTVRVWSDGSPLFLAVRSNRLTVTPAPWGLSIVSLGPDDAPDHPAFAPTSRMENEHLFEFSEDVDVFRIEPTPGHVYEAECQGLSYCHVDLLGTDGIVTRGSSTLRFRGPTDGASFLRFGGQSTGAWTRRLVDLGPDDHGDAFETATPVGPGQSLRGTLEFAGDLDAFTLSYPRGTVLRFSTPADKEIQGVEQFLVVREGVTLVVVQGARGPYDIGVDSSTADPGGGEWAQVPISLPFSVDGGFEFPGDTDVFAFDGVAGHVYRATVVSSPPAYVQLRGDSSARQHSGQGGSQLVTLQSGPITLSVMSDRQGPYQLSISDIGVDDYSDTNALLGPVTAGASIHGVFDWARDIDVFAATMVPGRFYEGRCSTADCMVRRGPYMDGRVGAFCQLATTAQSALSVESNDFDAVGSRPWSLELVDLGVDDHADTQLAATDVPFDSSSSATLSCHADVDAFRWTAGPRQLTALRASCDGCTVSVSFNGRTEQATAVDGGLGLIIGPWIHPHIAFFSTGDPTALTFSVSDGGFDDYGDTLTSATLMTPGASVVGKLQFAGDVDAFAWDLPAGGRPAELTGANVRAEIWQATGLVTGLTTSSQQFVAPTAGRYFVLVTGSGDFQLVVQ